ncbi:ABC transporter ATP-binding protein [bacterium]|nr:ABC transporter ATP-binding protein [candidate division CSSED10-310 bacterium]
MNESIVKITNVAKQFGGIRAVDHLNLTVSRGSVVALLGPNGAGKTTTIRMMLDLLRPDSGTIEVIGMNPRTHAKAIRQRCGYVPERPRMIPWMTIRKIMDFTAPFYPTWDPAYSSALLSRLKLNENQKIRNLSRGEEARLALLLGLAFKPELLILDDATSGIDPAARRDILENVIQVIHEAGTTIIFATHLLHEIEGLADEAVFLIDGTIKYAGRMDDIKQSFKRVIAWSDVSLTDIPPGATVVTGKKTGPHTEWMIKGFRNEAWQKLMSEHHLEIQDVSLEEIYLACHDESAG